MKRRIFCGLAAAWMGWAAAATMQADRVDRLVQAQLEEKHIPGLALAVVRDGRIAKARGYGWANLEWRVPATAQTVFEIGSVTKQFTAALVMMLAEEGRVRLDDPVTRFFTNAPPIWEGITVRHLLTHTSGLRNYTGLPGFEVTRGLTREDFVRTLGAYPLEARPGDRYAYCNSGYNLLGYIIEEAGGAPYWQAFESRICRPHGMAETRSRDLRALIPRRADGYERKDDRWINRDSDLTEIFSAGAVASTVLDLARWAIALETGSVLSESSRNDMWAPTRLNDGGEKLYGLGWGVDPHGGRRNIGHSGSTSGFSASLQWFPDDRLWVIVLCNLDGQGLATQIALEIADRFLPASSR
ncbi:MAG TPA: serine hydrolase domain-containing protein [Candidatus Paceibacterota bacterium]|nr:beta-lactamase family protein [Verrucomicrobiota bacterium]HOX03531.1 serine hydrolase domain-containing protein [Verrucomicrobiota bacterium]HRZ46421.1 serine hydrolase domain-containing protein [Candidatus Paceibacterota bacterium]HRZ93703.1 serine hydrolase domain-containing protein [Candidatus Paceibacterota bacterium]